MWKSKTPRTLLTESGESCWAQMAGAQVAVMQFLSEGHYMARPWGLKSLSHHTLHNLKRYYVFCVFIGNIAMFSAAELPDAANR